VTVFHGRPGFALTGEQFWHQNAYGVQDRIEISDVFGSALASGDYNRDGFADLAVGVGREDIGSALNLGAVNVITGAATGLHAGADCLLLPAVRQAGALFGFALAR
jgi:hypothetical protein